MPELLTPDPPRVRAVLALSVAPVRSPAGERVGALVMRRWSIRCAAFAVVGLAMREVGEWDFVGVVAGVVLLCAAVGMWESSAR